MLCVLVNTGFQVLFHSPSGVLFTFPSRYCFTIGHQVVFRLGWWSTLLHTKFLVFGATPDPASPILISFTGLSPSLVCLPRQFYYDSRCLMQSSTPRGLLPKVWPPPISLAATLGISFDFSSSAYLDVSVRRVTFLWLCVHHRMMEYCSIGLPHSDIHESIPICGSSWLFAACRVLHRLLMPRHSPCALYNLT